MSFLYNPLKALGLYASNVPLNIKSVGENEFYIFSAVGCYFLVYRFSNLALIGTSDKLDENIISISGYKNNFFCGCESRVYGFTRAKHVSKIYEYEGETNWRIVQVLGEEGNLVGVNGNNRLVIWEIATGNVVNTYLFPKEKDEFVVQSVMQPKGYENKILVAGTKGKMQLINYMKNNLVYAFDLKVEISVLAQTPNNDTIAIGCEDGSVLLHNLVYDKTVVKMSQDLGAVASIGFRSDTIDSDREEMLVMLVGTRNGHVTLWNLAEMRSIGQARHCHMGPVATMFCVPSKPLLVTSGPDNSIKVWNYDRPDGTPVLLRSRSGHWLPPSRINYWPRGALSAEIISAGADSCVNVFNAYEERQNFSMGRAYLPGKQREDRLTREQYVLPAASHVATCSAQDGFWDSVAICHAGRRQVTTWNFNKRTRGKFYLDLFTTSTKFAEFKYKRVVATRCAISSCGNFLVIGYSSGHIGKFNIQSGIARGQFVRNTTPAVGDDDRAHETAVEALVIGRTESQSVLVSGANRDLIQWDLKKHGSIATLEFGCAIAEASLHPNGDIVAVSMQNGVVNLVQLARFVVFQQVLASPMGNAVLCVVFTHDVDNLMVLADGKLIKTFDYINNKLVDCFKVHKRVTQLAVAPNDAFLVTTHADDLGLYLWALKLHLYNIKLTGLPIDYEPQEELVAPKMYCNEEDEEQQQEGHEGAHIDEQLQTVMDVDMEEPRLLDNYRLVQFSGLPGSFFVSLLNLENIRIRNENDAIGLASTEFFLPQITETLGGLRWIDENDDNDNDDNKEEQEENKQEQLVRLKKSEKKRRIAELKASKIVSEVKFVENLENAQTNADYDRCMRLLVEMSPSSVDYEIQKLDPLDQPDNSYKLICAFLNLLLNQFQRARAVELCQMYLACFLKHHIDCLIEDSTCSSYCAGDAVQIKIDELISTELTNQQEEQQFNRKRALELVSQCVVVMRSCCQSLSRDLIQIIEMAQFSYNSL